jgi:hypothetical protein
MITLSWWTLFCLLGDSTGNVPVNDNTRKLNWFHMTSTSSDTLAWVLWSWSRPFFLPQNSQDNLVTCLKRIKRVSKEYKQTEKWNDCLFPFFIPIKRNYFHKYFKSLINSKLKWITQWMFTTMHNTTFKFRIKKSEAERERKKSCKKLWYSK